MDEYPADHLDREELAVDYGTMKDYFWNIVTGGGYSTDQDIWEYVVDIAIAYNDSGVLGIDPIIDPIISDKVIQRTFCTSYFGT